MTTAPGRSRFEKWLGVILVAMSVATVVIVAVYSTRLSDVTECQAEYNQAYAEAIQARSRAARDERQAMREMLTSFLTGKRLTPAQGRAVFEKYLGALDAADKARDGAQLPTRRC